MLPRFSFCEEGGVNGGAGRHHLSLCDVRLLCDAPQCQMRCIVLHETFSRQLLPTQVVPCCFRFVAVVRETDGPQTKLGSVSSRCHSGLLPLAWTKPRTSFPCSNQSLVCGSFLSGTSTVDCTMKDQQSDKRMHVPRDLEVLCWTYETDSSTPCRFYFALFSLDRDVRCLSRTNCHARHLGLWSPPQEAIRGSLRERFCRDLSVRVDA